MAEELLDFYLPNYSRVSPILWIPVRVQSAKCYATPITPAAKVAAFEKRRR
jgi:hypothetical protein